jgi:hypothetical protein
VGCFDPTRVVARLREEFPEIEVDPRDHSQKDIETFKLIDNAGSALRVAEADARRRGPIWSITLPLDEGRELKGHAARYYVCLRDDRPIPEPMRSRLLAFLNGLRFAEYVEVSSVRVEGSKESPA